MTTVVQEHKPVLLREAIELLAVRPGGTYVDCTAGAGGHALKIAELLDSSGRLIVLDRDPQALELARTGLERPDLPCRVDLFRENFKNLPLILNRLGISALEGCLVDLGVSSIQLDAAERGFSFRLDGPLDMRMDPDSSVTAADLVNRLSKEQLADLFRRYGEEKQANQVARAIVEARRAARIQTTRQLAAIVETVKARKARGRQIHPATQVFQALRIEVNQELEGLEEFLEDVIQTLSPGGRLVLIAFHSLEDRIVKRVFRKAAGRCICFRPRDLCRCPREEQVRLLSSRPVKASAEESSNNPRARSARLRAAEKL